MRLPASSLGCLFPFFRLLELPERSGLFRCTMHTWGSQSGCLLRCSAEAAGSSGRTPRWPVAFRAVPLMRITRLCVSPNVSRGSCVLPHGLGQDIHHDREKPTVVLFCVLRSTVLRYSHPGLSATASPLRYDPSPAWPGVCRPLLRWVAAIHWSPVASGHSCSFNLRCLSIHVRVPPQQFSDHAHHGCVRWACVLFSIRSCSLREASASAAPFPRWSVGAHSQSSAMHHGSPSTVLVTQRSFSFGSSFPMLVCGRTQPVQSLCTRPSLRE